MLYLLATINLVLTGLCGLSFYNISTTSKNLGLLELAVMWLSIVLLLVTNIGIIWVNKQRGNTIGELQRKNAMLEQKLITLEREKKEGHKDQNA